MIASLLALPKVFDLADMVIAVGLGMALTCLLLLKRR